ncbi:DUF3397 domain-containing protein [Sporosarcina sp.]|uniref:DUF3397 domain-containing protein n=1 Tax=Sporosarcina sp. TaxID=49982 RepID=UPI00261C2DFC|nr:DUF3397 domain-containing protein [Sporosarcina sp.]
MAENIIGAILLFPFIVLFVLLLVFKKIRVTPSKRFGLAVDFTTPFVASAVTVLLHAIWDQWLGVYVIGTVCVIAILFSIIERIKEKEFRTQLVLRKTWRVFFLLVTAAYFLLIISGIILQIIHYAK